MPKVYILNRGGHDYSAAERFGELVVLSDGILPRENTSHMVRVLAPIRESSPHDYILLSSLSIMCSIACSMFALRHGKLNILIFKGVSYVERRIDFTSPLPHRTADEGGTGSPGEEA